MNKEYIKVQYASLWRCGALHMCIMRRVTHMTSSKPLMPHQTKLSTSWHATRGIQLASKGGAT